MDHGKISFETRIFPLRFLLYTLVILSCIPDVTRRMFDAKHQRSRNMFIMLYAAEAQLKKGIYLGKGSKLKSKMEKIKLIMSNFTRLRNGIFFEKG